MQFKITPVACAVYRGCAHARTAATLFRHARSHTVIPYYRARSFISVHRVQRDPPRKVSLQRSTVEEQGVVSDNRQDGHQPRTVGRDN
jgi:hypothetical protein